MICPVGGRVLLILSEDDTTFTRLPGGPDRPDVKSHGGHRPDRRAPGADGAAGTVRRSGNKIYFGADIETLLFFQHVPDCLGRTSKLLLKSMIEVGYAVVPNRCRYLLYRHIALL